MQEALQGFGCNQENLTRCGPPDFRKPNTQQLAQSCATPAALEAQLFEDDYTFSEEEFRKWMNAQDVEQGHDAAASGDTLDYQTECVFVQLMICVFRHVSFLTQASLSHFNACQLCIFYL